MLVKMELSLPTEARYLGMMRNVAHRVLADIGAPEQDNSDIQLAVTEACANAVRHSDGGEYLVRLEVGDDGCEVEVVDRGTGFEPREIHPQHTDLESGRGLWLMQSLVDDLQFVHAQDGTHVRLRKDWGNSPNPAGPFD